jgi:HEAT repeat protein
LGKIDPGNQQAIEVLVRILDTTASEDIHWSAAESLGEIGTGNQQAIEALVRILDTTASEVTRRRSAECLGKIDPGNQQAIEALVRILDTAEHEWSAAECLGEIDPGNQQAIEVLVRILDTTEPEFIRRRAAECLGEILQKSQMPSVVSALQHCLADEVYQTNFDRFEKCYKVIWRCAQNMTYPAFYQAWHQQEGVGKTTTCDSQSLNQADLPQSL